MLVAPVRGDCAGEAGGRGGGWGEESGLAPFPPSLSRRDGCVGGWGGGGCWQELSMAMGGMGSVCVVCGAERLVGGWGGNRLGVVQGRPRGSFLWGSHWSS